MASREQKRRVLVAVVLFIAVTFLVTYLNLRVPMPKWLLPRFGSITAATLFFGLSCFSVGHAALSRILPRRVPVPFRERLLLDFSVGVLLFAIALFLVGLAGGLGAVSFYGIPLACLAIGAPSVVSTFRRITPRLLRFRRRVRAPVSLVTTLATAFGAIGLLLVYLPILVAGNAAFDSRWYHLGLAEHYATLGRIAACPNGWYLASQPHLATWLYTWALSLPGTDLHYRVELAAHLEFLLFLVTVAGIPLLVERLLYGKRVRGSWAAIFLFPGLFLYDSNLSVAADHALAFWAVPIALTALRFTRTWGMAEGLLLAATCAGAALTKSQALYFLIPAALYVLWKAAVALRAGRLRRGEILRLAAPTVGGSLAFTSPFWLSNLVWNGNPVYPFLSTWFHSYPVRSGAGNFWQAWQDSGWTPEGPLWHRIGETLLSPILFSFGPHDWDRFHRTLPVFGFLFSLSLVVLPFIPRAARIRALALGTAIGIWFWFWTYHQDRYLQALLPWMVAVTVAVLNRAWVQGLPSRIAICALVAVQILWATDIPFLPTHPMIGGSPVVHAIELLSTTYRSDKKRFENPFGYEEVAKALPPSSRVLLHQESMRLGIGHPAFSDNPRYTGAATYAELGSIDKVYARLRSWGVTHVVAKHESCGHGNLPLSSEVLLHYAISAWSSPTHAGGYDIWQVPESAGAALPNPSIAYLGCGQHTKTTVANLDAVYDADRAHSTHAAALGRVTEGFLRGVDALAVDERCHTSIPETGFRRLSHWRGIMIWGRDFSQK